MICGYARPSKPLRSLIRDGVWGPELYAVCALLGLCVEFEQGAMQEARQKYDAV